MAYNYLLLLVYEPDSEINLAPFCVTTKEVSPKGATISTNPLSFSISNDRSTDPFSCSTSFRISLFLIKFFSETSFRIESSPFAIIKSISRRFVDQFPFQQIGLVPANKFFNQF